MNFIHDVVHEFSTQMTFDGLKITLKSTIDIVDYLLNKCNFTRVSTAKLNRNCVRK